MKKAILIIATALAMTHTTHSASFAPRLTTTIDASTQMSSDRLSMAQGADQDFAFTFSNLQTSFDADNDSCVWFYTGCDYEWQVAVTGTIESATTAVISVDPAHSNTNTASAGAFPWRLEVQNVSGDIIAKGYGSLTIEKNIVADGTPVLITTTNINASDYNVSGQWPVSSIPPLTAYVTAATNTGVAGQVYALAPDGTNTILSSVGSGDITAVNITAGTGLTGTVFTASGDHDQTLALDADSVAGLALADSAVQTELDPSNAVHVADAVDAHEGTAIGFTPYGDLVAIEVEAALKELEDEKIPYTGADKPVTIDSGNASTNTFGGKLVVLGESVQSGVDTEASGDASHAEGLSTAASGDRSHAEGLSTTASGDNSHAEGYNCEASGVNSHAEGNQSRRRFYDHSQRSQQSRRRR